MDPGDLRTVTNPILVVEVSSPSTENYDRGPKALMYSAVPSLRAYVMVSQDAQVVEVVSRASEDDDWQWATRRRQKLFR